MAGPQRSGFDIVFDTFRQSREQELETGRARLRLHGKLLPLRRAFIARVDANGAGLDAAGLGADDLIGMSANRRIARRDPEIVERSGAGTAGPKKRRTVTAEAGPPHNQPDQYTQRGKRRA